MLKVETEAGTRRGSSPSARSRPQQPAGWQGTSAAFWQPAGGGGGRRGGGAPSRGGSLRVVTTNLQPGYLRRNGVPYSANATADGVLQPRQRSQRRRPIWWSPRWSRTPPYLNARWVTSTHFKKAPDGTPWTPAPANDLAFPSRFPAGGPSSAGASHPHTGSLSSLLHFVPPQLGLESTYNQRGMHRRVVRSRLHSRVTCSGQSLASWAKSEDALYSYLAALWKTDRFSPFAHSSSRDGAVQ